MTHPNPGQQPGPPQYPGQPQHPGQPHPGPQYPGQQYPGQPFPGQPHPGQPYPGQPYPGQPRPPSKAMAVVSGLLYLPGTLLALAGSISLATRGALGYDLWGAVLMPPFPRFVIGFDLVVTISFVLPGLALVLAVLLMARVPGVRWALVAISLVAAVHYGMLLANIMSALPPTRGIMPAVGLVLWLVAGLVAVLPPVGRAMRGAKTKTPPQFGPPMGGPPMAGPPMTGPPPGVPGPPPPQGQWG